MGVLRSVELICFALIGIHYTHRICAPHARMKLLVDRHCHDNHTQSECAHKARKVQENTEDEVEMFLYTNEECREVAHFNFNTGKSE